MNKDFITPKETAEYLGIGMNGIYRLLNENDSFPACRIGRKWFIKKDMIDTWLDQKIIEK